MKTLGVTDYTKQKPTKHFNEKMSKLKTLKAKVKYFVKCAYNKRCTSSMCKQPVCKV